MTEKALPTASPVVQKFLEQQAWLNTNAETNLSEEEKATAITYESLTDAEKDELNTMVAAQMQAEKRPIRYQHMSAPRKPLSQKQQKARKKKKSMAKASRKANRKK